MKSSEYWVLEVFNKIKLITLILILKNLCPFAGDETFLPGSYRSTLTLVQHSDQDRSTTLVWVIMSSVFLLRTLQLSGYFGPKRNLVKSIET